MTTRFCTIDEKRPANKWRQRYLQSWPAYREWYLSQGLSGRPSSALGRRKLRQYMPELLSTYDDLCTLAGDDGICHRFLSLYDPPRLSMALPSPDQVVWRVGLLA